MSCVFCTSNQDQLIWQDSDYKIIRDISPKATSHWLLIPKTHHKNINSISDITILKRMKDIAIQVYAQEGKKDGLFGFHVPPFTSVDHLHLHIIERPFTSIFGSILFPSFNSLWFKTIDSAIANLE